MAYRAPSSSNTLLLTCCQAHVHLIASTAQLEQRTEKHLQETIWMHTDRQPYRNDSNKSILYSHNPLQFRCDDQPTQLAITMLIFPACVEGVVFTAVATGPRRHVRHNCIRHKRTGINPPRIAYNAIPCRSSWTCDINRTAITSATCQQECRHLRRTGGMPELQAQAFQQIGVARLAMPLVYVLRASINVASGFAAPF